MASLLRTWPAAPGSAPAANLRALPVAPRAATARDWGRVGVILNGRAHRNRAGLPGAMGAHALAAAPASLPELDRALAEFAEHGVGTLVVSGGDGTIRDILTAAPAHFGDALPRLSIVPSGKTNALAVDLGVPARWSLEDAVRAATSGDIAQRAPIEIRRDGQPGPALRGFLFGAGAFVRATALAQGTHRIGAFNGLAIGLSLTAAVTQTLFARGDNVWRRGEPVRLDIPDGRRIMQPLYILLGSTLERLPLGIRPFGPARPGLKLLGVEAPPRAIVRSLPAILSGAEDPHLAERGYHRLDLASFRLGLASRFILDGEVYDGGALAVRTGAPVDFLVAAR